MHLSKRTYYKTNKSLLYISMTYVREISRQYQFPPSAQCCPRGLCGGKSEDCRVAEGDGWPHRWECMSCCLSLCCWTTMVGVWLVEATAGGMSIIRWQTSMWNAHSGQPLTLSQPRLRSKYFKQAGEGKKYACCLLELQGARTHSWLED